MSLTNPQTITGNKTFVDTLSVLAPSSLTAETINLDGDLNGVDLERFAESVWISGRGDEVAGIKTFTENTTLGKYNMNKEFTDLLVPPSC